MHLPSLGIVSDEISPDLREAVRYGTSWGISRFEIHCLKSGRVPAVDRAELDDVIVCMKEHNIMITALSPGIFKHPLSKGDLIEHELTSVLPDTIALAERFRSPLIIVFGFQREPSDSPEAYARAVTFMCRAARMAADHSMRLAIENEPGFWCDSGKNTLRLIRDVGSPALGANWDPCNSYGTDEAPYPDGYEAIKSAIINVHVKDTKKGALVQCVPVGEGVLDWRGQIAALAKDNLVEHITIETHCLPLVENSRRNVETLRRIMSQIASED